MSDWQAKHYEDRTDEWGTPPNIWRPIAQCIGGFDLDPCSGAENSPIADARFTAGENGLHQSWWGNVWVNPPYSEMDKWSRKIVSESKREGVDTVVVLLPVRSSTDWFQEAVPESTVICLIDSRIQFVGENSTSAPFASALGVWGDCPEPLMDHLDSRGIVFSSGELYESTVQLRLGGSDD